MSLQHEWNECWRKRRFKRKEQAHADRWARLLRLRAYRCRYCDGWHLTSKETP